MNRLNNLFEQKQSEILSVYFTAGYPGLDDTVTILRTLEKSGVDLVEIGMPFSDPMADGPVIQQSNDIRSKVTIPLIMMGYLNPVMQYGIENFCRKCNELGLDGVILPDLPYEIYIEKYQSVFEKNNLHKIFLVSPQTSGERIRKIDAISNGFIYMVSSSSTTGAKDKIVREQEDYFLRLQQMNLKNPRLIGFGISNNETFQRACKYAGGAIIGSAFIRALSEKGDLEESIKRFVKMIRGVPRMQSQ
jgi:tryptophan synthase alpha chain